jgi:branched-chain amino acid transport system ATP-binding protein
MLEATSLMVFYENMLALNNVNIRCEENRIVGVFGANSAGKSTLMYTLSGIMEDIRKKEEMAGGERITVVGRIHYNGEDISDWKPSRRARKGLILCPERRRIFSESSVLENLKIGGYLATPAQARETMDYVFKLFPALLKLKKRVGGFLSGGEQQMLAIGMALVVRPKLLLLDEPLLGLSPMMQQSVMEAVVRLRKNSGITVLISEQFARPVLPIIDRGYVVENGMLALYGTGKELMDNPEIKSAYFGI